MVDYTVGVATKDQAKQQKAVEDLVGYSQDFGAFLASANPNLPKDVVAGLVKDHILTLKPVIDAQAAGDQPKVYTHAPLGDRPHADDRRPAGGGDREAVPEVRRCRRATADDRRPRSQASTFRRSAPSSRRPASRAGARYRPPAPAAFPGPPAAAKRAVP